MTTRSLINLLDPVKKELEIESESEKNFQDYIINFVFKEDGKHSKTKIDQISIKNQNIQKFTNEFWTSKQRQTSSLHEISYRACFKAQLPRFFINELTRPKDVVYDPFSGRGTTVIEAGLLKRNVILNDINPLSKILAYPRFFIPKISQIQDRLDEINFDYSLNSDIDLSMFYHKKTLSEITSIKNYMSEREVIEKIDIVDGWIRMVATNRLTGHSNGFFSVYTLPPNQAVTPNRQIKINEKRDQTPEYRDVKNLILRKSKSLLKDITEKNINNLSKIGKKAILLNKDARDTPEIENESVNLIVTSPPFLNIVQYSKDNWLRCWFNSIDDKEISKKITMSKKIEDWSKVMEDAFKEFYRILRPNGHIAFEVGEVKNKKINMDEFVVPIGKNQNFECIGILINEQVFTKTSNIWGIKNNKRGTNTNRIVIFKKEE